MYNYNDDYVILFDENGQPYIAHANLRDIANKVGNVAKNAARRVGSALKGLERPGHKYYARLDDPKRPGKYLYFYSKEELDRYQNKSKVTKNSFEGADKVYQQARDAYNANPTQANKEKMQRARDAALKAHRSSVQSAYDARQAQSAYDKSINGRANNAFESARNATDNAVKNARDKVQRMRDELKKKVGVGAKAAYEKEQKEADEANARYDRILQGYRDAYNRGDKTSEQRLGNTLKLYNEFREKENREARDTKNAYDSSLAGKANKMIEQAKATIKSTKATASEKVKAGMDAVNAASEPVVAKAASLKNMSTEQIKKANDNLESALNTAKSAANNVGNSIKAGRDAIQNTTGIGLRQTAASKSVELGAIEGAREETNKQYRQALSDGDQEKASELRRTSMLLGEQIEVTKRQQENAQTTYNNSIAGKAKVLSDSALQALQKKYNDGKTLTSQELANLFATIFKDSK